MAKFQTIFVTGGAGYIGSHCVVELLEAGYDVVACDNFANSVNGEKGTAPSLERVEEITGKKVTFYQCDLLDYERLDKIFSQVFLQIMSNLRSLFISSFIHKKMQHKVDCVIHFAAMKAVGESMEVPLLYYKNNVVGTINLLEVNSSFS